jgi:hypothetical protein
MVSIMNFTINGEPVMAITILNLVHFAAVLRKLNASSFHSMPMISNALPLTCIILFYIFSQWIKCFIFLFKSRCPTRPLTLRKHCQPHLVELTNENEGIEKQTT